MKRLSKDTSRRLFFHGVRWMERRLSVRNLYRILRLHAFVRAALKGIPASVPLPACLGASTPVRTTREWWIRGFLNQLLEYLPDRLAEPKWMDRCRIAGLDQVLQARQNGRPVVLAFSHFGAFRLSRFWLRAAGVPTATLHNGRAKNRTRLKKLEDGFCPFPEIPTAFYLDQLREVSGFLAAGNSLLIAMDHAAGNQMSVPVCDGWTFRMATGAVRLAVRHRAELIPCVVLDEGRWRFQIKLGRPVPAEYLAAEIDLTPAGKHLLNEMLPHFRNHPKQCSSQLIKCFHLSPAATADATLDENPR